LNNSLTEFGYPAADYAVANTGIGFQLITNRMVTSMSYNWYTKETDEELFLTEVEYNAFSLNFGYDLLKFPYGSAYPYVGFKGSGLNYLYKEKIAEDTSTENYLESNLEYKELSSSRAHLDLGFGISFQTFFLVNFRAGYLLPLEKSNWKFNSGLSSLTNSPSINYPYYFTLTLGTGMVSYSNENTRTRGPKF